MQPTRRPGFQDLACPCRLEAKSTVVFNPTVVCGQHLLDCKCRATVVSLLRSNNHKFKRPTPRYGSDRGSKRGERCMITTASDILCKVVSPPCRKSPCRLQRRTDMSVVLALHGSSCDDRIAPRADNGVRKCPRRRSEWCSINEIQSGLDRRTVRNTLELAVECGRGGRHGAVWVCV